MQRIDAEEIAKKYNLIDEVWDINDKWHLVTHEVIKKFIWDIANELKGWKGFKILNAGSCGYSYGLDETNIVHIDIASDKLRPFTNSIVASIEAIPLASNSIDTIICVGSVINYCDPVAAFSELSRVLTSQGYLILEFENSYTFELLGKPSFNKSAALVETFYKGEKEKIWFFSETYIKELARLNDLEVLTSKRWHILSPLIYRITKNETSAAKYAKLDGFLSHIPFLKNFCSNSILLLKKN